MFFICNIPIGSIEKISGNRIPTITGFSKVGKSPNDRN